MSEYRRRHPLAGDVIEPDHGCQLFNGFAWITTSGVSVHRYATVTAVGTDLMLVEFPDGTTATLSTHGGWNFVSWHRNENRLADMVEVICESRGWA